MTWAVQPEPADDAERRLLEQALEQALPSDGDVPPYTSRWWRSGLADLGGGSAAEQSGRDAGVVEA